MRTLKGERGPARQSEHLEAPKDRVGDAQRPARCEQGTLGASWEAAGVWLGSDIKKVCVWGVFCFEMKCHVAQANLRPPI